MNVMRWVTTYPWLISDPCFCLSARWVSTGNPPVKNALQAPGVWPALPRLLIVSCVRLDTTHRLAPAIAVHVNQAHTPTRQVAEAVSSALPANTQKQSVQRAS